MKRIILALLLISNFLFAQNNYVLDGVSFNDAQFRVSMAASPEFIIWRSFDTTKVQIETDTLEFSGYYLKLPSTSNHIVLGDGQFSSISSLPFLPSSYTQTKSDWNSVSGLSEILNKPVLFSGSYTDLIGKPTLFSGDYNDLSNKPTLNLSNWNAAYSWGDHSTQGYMTSFTELDPTISTYTKSLTSFSIIKSSTDPLYLPINYITTFSTISGIPTTLAGYGITNAFTKTESDVRYLQLYTETDPLFNTKFSSKSTSDLIEGSNLYYTSARFNTAFSSKSTSDLAEGTNLYFTNSRARSSLSSGNEITYDSSTGIISKTKKTVPYSGTTNASGVYTVTFATSYSVAPNIQANIINGTDTQNIRITSISTTGFTVLVRNRTDVIGLLPSYSNVSGANVDVLIQEK